MMDFVGQTIGHYRIEVPLGSGGMGQVYRGVHQQLKRPAAIKVLQARLAEETDFRSRFLREAQYTAALKHPNIVQIYDFGEQGGYLYLVMELMTDGSVRTLLRTNPGLPLPLPLGLELVGQAARGLAAAQAKGMVHRDIKPDNLLLNRLSGHAQGGEQYELKISDFGLARLAEADPSRSGFPAGTPAYMSPEQCQGKPLDGRSDLYSLGVVLYEVATGYRPFQVGTFEEAMHKHVHVAPTPPRQVRADVPPLLEEIILRCLAKQPEERFATGTELASALQRLLSTLGAGGTDAAELPTLPAAGAAVRPAGGTPAPAVSTLPGPSAVPRVRVLDQSGQTLQVVDVNSQGLIIGRQSGNDLVLPSQEISRRHVQIRWDGEQVTVTDLGSSNGTLLDGVQLLPHVSEVWRERQMMRIGPFWLRLEPASQIEAFSTQAIPPSAFAAGSTVRTAILSERIGITATPRTLTITPGQPAMVQVTLTNLGNTVDWFTTTVEGVPAEWVPRPVETPQLNPGMQQAVELHVDVARTPSNRAQVYPVTIRARSREQPNESGTTQARWTVSPFKGEDALRLEPHTASGRGRAAYTVALKNAGNTPSDYELSLQDEEQQMAYRFRQNPVAIENGREARVPLEVRTRRHWLGRAQRRPFQVHARPADSSIPLTTPGEFIDQALIPVWGLPVVCAVLAAAVALGALFHVPPFPGKGQLTPTPTIGTLVTPTSAPPQTTQPISSGKPPAPLQNQPAPFSVTKLDVSARPPNYNGPCTKKGMSFTFTATISVLAGTPGGTVTYQWLESDNYTTPQQTVTFNPGETTKTVPPDTWTYPATPMGNVTDTLQVNSPNAMTSKANFSWACQYSTAVWQYDGTWSNGSPSDGDIEKLEISNAGYTLTVHAYQLCKPKTCDWGPFDVPFTGEPIIVTFVFEGQPGVSCKCTSNQQLSITLDPTDPTKLIVVDRDLSTQSSSSYTLQK